jgi:carbamoyltransferase
MRVLGINCAYHESAACLVIDGDVAAFAEEERFSRVKRAKRARVDNSGELPWRAIAACLEVAGVRDAGSAVDLSVVDLAAFSLRPSLRHDANVRHAHPYAPAAGDFGTSEGEARFRASAWSVEPALRSRGLVGPVLFLDHHACHADSAFLTSGFDDAAVLVVDGIGEFDSVSLFDADGDRLELLQREYFPHSLGLLWERFARFAGFDEYDAAKLMGLAPYGDPSHRRVELQAFVSPAPLRVDDRVTRFRSPNFEPLEEALGLARRRERIETVTDEVRPYADVAAALQELTELALLDLAAAAAATGRNRLCLSGGVALNCVANGRLLREAGFADIWIPPAANDAGTAVGAALHAHRRVLRGRAGAPARTPYLGPCYGAAEVRDELERLALPYQEVDDPARAAADLLAEGRIVGWFQGRMEAGPRALGNRSLLADPRDAAIVPRINAAVKHREAFRPFCPSVMAEAVQAWFECDAPVPALAELMLATFRARPDRRDRIPAVLHVDGTARLQAVTAAANPDLHRLLAAFGDRTGVPLVLNTSFNDQEPIVCTPRDAIVTFLQTDIDHLVLGSCVVDKAACAVVVPVPDIPLTEYFEKLR